MTLMSLAVEEMTGVLMVQITINICTL